jgi:dTDP-4-amino-4,6-dideoxygalactose transaminase
MFGPEGGIICNQPGFCELAVQARSLALPITLLKERTLISQPAVLGGGPAFAEQLPLTRPTLRLDDAVARSMRRVLESGMTTNGPEVAAFEEEAAAFLGVGHVVAVSSCTTGLLLLLRCLNVSGDVVIPSFTFMATGHAAHWNELGVAFADADPSTWTVDPRSVSAAVGETTGAIMTVHTFGAPSDVPALQELASRSGVPLLVDAAHGFGAHYPDGTRVGSKATAEVFSLSPTKPLSAGEGGLIATDNKALSGDLRVARDYGNPGDYDSRFVGLNGRMPELSAVLGRANLGDFPYWIERRRILADRYAHHLADLPGLDLQVVPEGARSAFKDFSIRVRAEAFGLNRDQLAACLGAENISTRCYFDPPLHRQTAYRQVPHRVPLPVTDSLSDNMLTLPLYSHMEPALVDRVCSAIEVIYANRAVVTERLARRPTAGRAVRRPTAPANAAAGTVPAA